MFNQEVLISIDVKISNAQSLWDMASSNYEAHFTPDRQEIVETIGPREDPDVLACAMLLFEPARRQSAETGAQSNFVVSDRRCIGQSISIEATSATCPPILRREEHAPAVSIIYACTDLD